MSAIRSRRWWIIGAVLSVVVAVVIAAVFYATTRRQAAKPQSATSLGLPAQLLLTSSMRKQPVPGWQISAEQLGLPPGGVPKLLGNVGNRGIFLGITGTEWWLVGIDVVSGRRLFAPVEIGRVDDALAFDCLLNGPSMVLCIREDRDPSKQTRAWVVDSEKGELIFDGPTDLRISTTPNHPEVDPMGNYAVATVSGEGVHGVGAHAELTWFVPGGGHLSQRKDSEHDAPPQPLAVQDGSASSTTDVVFSLADGKVVTPEAPQGARFGRAMVYPGGFGYEYSVIGDDFSTWVDFFDESGKQMSRPNFKANLLSGSRDIPMVSTESSDVVLTLDARKLLELPKSTATPTTRLIGERLFVAGDTDEKSWRQYDLQNGASAKTCDIDNLGAYYIASDGEVAVLHSDAALAAGFDLATCDKLWSIPKSVQDVWRVSTTLIERINDELFSLVAPP